MNNHEIWKSIEDYEGLYEVSNFGNVRDYSTNVLIQQWNINGYYAVVLKKGTKKRMFKVHKLVAQLFLPNWDSSLFIDHKDADRSNNHISNLQLIIMAENNNPNKNSVHQIDPNTFEVVNTYKSFSAAARSLGQYSKNAGDNIRKTCTGTRIGQKAYGYFWELS